jgi:hypothetical protein
MGQRLTQTAVIRDIFPQFKNRIDELLRTNVDFRELCADYLLCKMNLEEFQRRLKDDKISVADYAGVTADLKRKCLNIYTQVVK